MINLIQREKQLRGAEEEPPFLLLFALRPFIHNNYFNELANYASLK